MEPTEATERKCATVTIRDLLIDESYILFERTDDDIWDLLDTHVQKKLKIDGMEIMPDGRILAQTSLDIPVGLYYATFNPMDSAKNRPCIEIMVHENNWLFKAHKRALGPIALNKRFTWSVPYEVSGCVPGKYTRL